MNSKIAPIAEYYRVGVLTITVVAYGAFGILLLSLASWLAVNRSRAARARSMGLWGFGVWFRDAWKCVS
jgi:hypothetical protein